MEVDSYISAKQQKRRKREMWFYAAAAFVSAYLVLVGFAWVFLSAPLFRVDAVTVKDNSAVSQGDVIALVESAALRSRGFLYWKAILGYGNMLVWPSSLSAADLSWNPRLASVTLSKNYWTHTITINVTERDPFGVWCFARGAAGAASPIASAGSTSSTAAAAAPPPNENCYLFDESGFIFARTLDTQGSLIYVVHDYSQTPGHISDHILPQEFISNMVSILDVLRASGISVSDITLNDLSLEEVDVATNNGPALYFSLRFPSDEDLQVLESIMTRADFNKLQYVDFRVENRAYYK